jgi:hypothetical protein
VLCDYTTRARSNGKKESTIRDSYDIQTSKFLGKIYNSSKLFHPSQHPQLNSSSFIHRPLTNKLKAVSYQTFNNLIWSIFYWSICGVNYTDKWLMVINNLEESSASIICWPETKKVSFDNSAIRKFAHRLFDHFACGPSVGASRVLLILWNSKVFTRRICMQESFGRVIEFMEHVSSLVGLDLFTGFTVSPFLNEPIHILY